MRSVLNLTTASVSLCAALLSAPSVAWTADCAQPVSETGGPTIRDCVSIARSSISNLPCRACVCDANGSGDVRITDALRCLWFVVGGEVSLDCPPCDDTSTTTLPQCASCNDVLTGLAPVEDLCESSQVIYDAMKACPCDACADDCAATSLCEGVQPTGAELASSTSFPCVQCVVDQCRQSVLDCVED
jgi:hypothetical protein